MSGYTEEQTLELVKARLKEMGDMPIFSASVNKINLVSSNPDANAMELAIEVLKDANLTTKVLKLANSPMFNTGFGKISSLSRAIIMLGFDTIKSAVVTLKLIDSFTQKYPGIDMESMLVSAYLTGGFVRGVSAKCGVRDIEQAYICGLLNNVGEIVTAYTLPEEFIKIQELMDEHQLSLKEAEKKVLGTSLKTLGQRIVEGWDFPQTVTRTLGEQRLDGNTRIKNQTDLTGAIANMASQTMELLYSKHPSTNKTLAELTYEMSKVAGIKADQISESLEQSFKLSCDLAKDYGLNKKHLTPRGNCRGDAELEKLARQFTLYADSEIPSVKAKAKPKPKPQSEDSEAAEAARGDSGILLNTMFDLTNLMAERAHINMILNKILEGMVQGIGFNRAVLCLLSPDHRSYGARMVAGDSCEGLKEFFNSPVDVHNDLFSKIIMEGNELLITDIHQGGWLQQLPANFVEAIGTKGFMLGALRAKTRPVGLFYADYGDSNTAISQEHARSFMQLVQQATLALQMR
jgi:HD-like signal output (HDOD) protein